MIETSIDGLALRNYTTEDIIPYAKYANNYNIWKFFNDDFAHPYTVDKAREYIERNCINNQTSHFAISMNEEFIGHILIVRQTDIHKLSGYLGYWLSENYWGQGLMTESVKALTKYIFETTDMIRIFAKVIAHNHGSIRVLEKAGYTQEGYFKNAIIKEGRIHDQIQFAKLK